MTTKHFHFSGICGTAMASLAVLLKSRGHKITGSDQNVYPPMSTFLEESGIEVMQGYKAENLQPHPDYVVLGNALSRGNPEVEYSLKAHLHYLSMAELLKNEFIRGTTSLVVSGTHGKSTTASLLAHVFAACEKPTGFLVGAIPLNFNTSSRDVAKGGYFVVEGDEYDTSLFDKRSKFFHYLPDRLIINNIEFDHADIFDDIGQIKKAFTLMLRQIPEDGLILANGDDANSVEVANKGYSPVVTFGTGKNCDAQITDITATQGSIGMNFKLTFQGETTSFSIPMFGEHNVRNAVSVILLAMHEKTPTPMIQKALSSFAGVKRRQQELTQNQEIRVFDDFAHHPTAIAETIKAIRIAWPKARLHAVYEARSNTSIRNVHQATMAGAFVQADTVTFSKIFSPKNVKPEDLLDLNQIVQEISEMGKDASVIGEITQIKEHCLQIAEKGDVFLVMSQGSFSGLPYQLAEALDASYA